MGGVWRPTDRVPPLATGTIQVWLVDLDREDLAAGAAALAADEAARAGRFRFPRDRRRFVAGRVALRRLLGAHRGRAPGALRFAYGDDGKPALDGDTDLTFNLAHSEDRALIACARGRALGVDLEAVRPIAELDDLARQVLAPAELADWRALPEGDRPVGFFRCWARKESYLKARGTGLRIPPTAVCVTLAPFPAPRMLDVPGLPDDARGYAAVDLPALPGFGAALTVAGAPDWTVVTLGFGALDAPGAGG